MVQLLLICVCTYYIGCMRHLLGALAFCLQVGRHLAHMEPMFMQLAVLKDCAAAAF